MTFIYLLDLNGAIDGPFDLPVVPGAGLQLPANALVLEQLLPAPAEGNVWVLGEAGPQQLVDLRGTYYSTVTGSEEEFAELGPLPEGLTQDPRPSLGHHWRDGGWALDANELHETQVKAVNRACEAAITGDFTSSALGAAYSYGSQLDDQLNLTGAILRGVDMPFACRDEHGVKDYREHTAAELRQVGDDFTLIKLQLLQRAQMLKQQLDQALASADLDALQAITWEASL